MSESDEEMSGTGFGGPEEDKMDEMVAKEATGKEEMERVWEEERSGISQRNTSLFRSGTVEEVPIPSLSLQVNIPVLSVSLSLLLLLLLGSLAVLGFKRKIHQRILKRGRLSTMEPRHIIYEIQTRRPVQENIYTLD
ncbi:hypothetical protein GJAV_G00134480 [Gymnothorax javanicus]|nr:hypothetical protein GJAV_G00134480 [Gymnothorax javanicus]